MLVISDLKINELVLYKQQSTLMNLMLRLSRDNLSKAIYGK